MNYLLKKSKGTNFNPNDLNSSEFYYYAEHIAIIDKPRFDLVYLFVDFTGYILVNGYYVNHMNKQNNILDKEFHVVSFTKIAIGDNVIGKVKAIAPDKVVYCNARSYGILTNLFEESGINLRILSDLKPYKLLDCYFELLGTIEKQSDEKYIKFFDFQNLIKFREICDLIDKVNNSLPIPITALTHWFYYANNNYTSNPVN